MGNTKSSSKGSFLQLRNDNHDPEEVSLAMMAVARKIFLKKVHVLALRYAMAKLSDDFGMITRRGFEEALARANLSKIEIFDLLFTMWDINDHGKVSYKEFCMGISPLACPFDDLPTIIGFALRVSDDFNRQYIGRNELHELLTGINSTASYFGDIHLLPGDIDGIVELVFEEGEEESTQKECIKRLSLNPYVRRFASGKPRMRVRFKEDLEQNFIFDKEKLVTEYIVDDIDDLVTSIACRNNNNKENTSSANIIECPAYTVLLPPDAGKSGNARVFLLISHSNSFAPAAEDRDPPSIGRWRGSNSGGGGNREAPADESRDDSSSSEIRDPPSGFSYSTFEPPPAQSISSRDPPSILSCS